MAAGRAGLAELVVLEVGRLERAQRGAERRDGAFQTLGPLDEAPFFACEMRVGAIGTRGGPRINARAEVMNTRGGIIPGLYAAGNAAATIFGMTYPGAVGTIGPALTFGHIAGRAAASSNNRY